MRSESRYSGSPKTALPRSEQMRRIRGRDTRPELRLRAALQAAEMELVDAVAPVGRPDLVVAFAVAVFVDGCFWHGCPEHYTRPATRPDFWAKRLADAVRRDRAQTLALEAAGWRVVRAWEHEIDEDLLAVVERVRAVAEDGAASALAWRVARVDPLDTLPGWERQHLTELRGQAPDRARERARQTTKWRRPPRSGGPFR